MKNISVYNQYNNNINKMSLLRGLALLYIKVIGISKHDTSTMKFPFFLKL